MNEKLIRIANDWAIVRREKQLTDIARKIEAYIIWKVKFDDTELPEVIINNDILMRCGLTRHDLDTKIQEVAEELLTYVIHYIKPDGKWGKTTLCSRFEQIEEGYRIRMDKALEPFFLEFKKNFAQFSIHPLLALGRSCYSHHLYQYLRTKIHSGNLKAWCRISIEDLKGLLGCIDEYNAWQDFKKRVLNPAMKEISKETDLRVNYRAESGPKGKAKKTVVFEIYQQEYQGILFDLNDNPIDYVPNQSLPTSVLDACSLLTFKPHGKSKELLLRAIADFSEISLVEALNNIQEDWKSASDEVRGGIVHKLMPSYLRRSKNEYERKLEWEEKIEDQEIASVAFQAEKAKLDRLAKEYVLENKRALYDSLDGALKSMFDFESCPVQFLEGLALDFLKTNEAENYS
jgi:hypothetical protein